MESIKNDIKTAIDSAHLTQYVKDRLDDIDIPSFRVFHCAALYNHQFITSTITFKENRYPYNFPYGSKNWLSDRVKEISDHLTHWDTFQSAICMPEFHKDLACHFHLIIILRSDIEIIRIRKSLAHFGHSKFDKATLPEAVKYFRYMMKQEIDTAAMFGITDLKPFILPIKSKELSSHIWPD